MQLELGIDTAKFELELAQVEALAYATRPVIPVEILVDECKLGV